VCLGDEARKLQLHPLQEWCSRRSAFLNDLVGTLGAAIADVDAGARNQLADLPLRPLAEGATEKMILHGDLLPISFADLALA
jgi:hypothetical protein